MRLEEVLHLAAEGESETLELKASTSELQDGLKALCGMLNTRGGQLLFGVRPGAEVVGQEVSEDTLHKLAQEINQKFEPSISPRIETVPPFLSAWPETPAAAPIPQGRDRIR